MDFHLKQWRDQPQNQESEEQRQPPQPSPAKMPRLLFQVDEFHSHPREDAHSDHATALPLFVADQTPSSKITNFPAYSDPTTSPISRFPHRGVVGGYFSVAQWQELELQALIFKHMVTGATIPPELLHLVKRSLLDSPSYYLHNYSYYQPALLQTGTVGYWGSRGGAMDAEPGRCRRTDGKKWRCSRDVVAGQKYCERHVHRGRNRSRKPVELPLSTTNRSLTSAMATNSAGVVTFGGGGCETFKSSAFATTNQGGGCGGEAHFALSGPTACLDILHHCQGVSDSMLDRRKLLSEPQGNEPRTGEDGKSGGRVLRHFFDDWPGSIQEATDSNAGNNVANSSTCLSISTPGNNPSMDFLKLSTGNAGDDPSKRVVDGTHELHLQPREQQLGHRLNWNRVGPMGGPLGEALRSSTGSSPTSVLHHQLPRSMSDT